MLTEYSDLAIIPKTGRLTKWRNYDGNSKYLITRIDESIHRGRKRKNGFRTVSEYVRSIIGDIQRRQAEREKVDAQSPRIARRRACDTVDAGRLGQRPRRGPQTRRRTPTKFGWAQSCQSSLGVTLLSLMLS